MSLTLVTAPPTWDLLADAKRQLRIDTSDEDVLLTALIAAAVEHLDGRDGILGRALLTQTWDLKVDAFPSATPQNPYAAIDIPLPPLQSVDGVTYVDASGNVQTVSTAAYTVDLGGKWPGKVTPALGSAWPPTAAIPDAVTIRFTAGYAASAGSPSDDGGGVPAGIKHAVMLLVAHWYENRVPVNIGNIVNALPMTVAALLAPHRVRTFF